MSIGITKMIFYQVTSLCLFSTVISASIGNNFIHLPMQRRERLAGENIPLHKRVYRPRENDCYTMFYTVALEVGTPPQTMHVDVDTGSADLWFCGPTNALCNDEISNELCDGSVITFDKTKSSTFKQRTEEFNLSYADSTMMYGRLGEDTVLMNGIKMDNVTFAIGESYNATPSMMGLGFTRSEFPGYVSLPYLWKDAGIINSLSYSIWLGPEGSGEAEILFGAYDKSRYEGSLTTFPMVPTTGNNISELAIELTELSWKTDNGSVHNLVSGHVAALLDTGNPFIIVPDATYVAKQVGASKDPSGAYMLPCDQTEKGFLTFIFNGVAYDLPVAEFVRPYSTDTQYNDEYGNVMCMLGILEDNNINGRDSPIILGDIFMKNFYTIYDLDRREISIALSSPVVNPASELTNYVIITSDGVDDSVFNTDARLWNEQLSGSNFTHI